MKRKIYFADSNEEIKKSWCLQGYDVAVAVIYFTLLIVSLIVFYEYYTALNTIKENSKKLQDAGDSKIVSVTAKPFKINLGQNFSKEAAKAYLVKLGYIQTDTNESATFNETDNTVNIYARFAEFSDLAVHFQKGRISTIQDLKSNKTLPTSELEPEVLNQYLPTATNEIGAVVHEQIKFDRDIANTVFLDALLVVENRNFFSEKNGISWKSLARAVSELAICKGGKLVGYNCKINPSGGSTLTAQIVKNLFLTNEQTISRKYEEFWLTVALENYLNSKQRIMELYLNNVVISEAMVKDSPNRQIVGFAAAAKYLYGKSLRDLNSNEAISLACLVKMPNKLLKRDEAGNLVNYNRLLERRNKYLADLNKIYPEKYSLETVNQAISEDINFKFDWQQEGLDKSSATYTAYTEKFTENLFKAEKLSFESEIVRIQTEADSELLLAMHQVLRNQLPNFADKIEQDSNDLKTFGSIVIYHTKAGKFLSINSLELEKGQLHLSRHAFDSTGQIMSLVKPFIVGFGLQKNKFRLSDKINPNACISNGWNPPENKLETRTLGQHLVSSNNLIPLCVLQKVGLSEFGDWWKLLTNKESTKDFRIANGLTSETNLSAVEVARLYGMFGNKGKITDASTVGRVLIGNKTIIPNQTGIQALSPETAKIMFNQLRSVIDLNTPDGNFGTAKTLLKDANLSNKGYKIFAKTGSGTNDYWIALGTGKIVIVVRLTVQSESNRSIDTQNVFASDTAAVVAKEVLQTLDLMHPELLKD